MGRFIYGVICVVIIIHSMNSYLQGQANYEKLQLAYKLLKKGTKIEVRFEGPSRQFVSCPEIIQEQIFNQPSHFTQQSGNNLVTLYKH